MKNMLYLLIGMVMSAAVFADAPKDAVSVMRPYPSICTPTLRVFSYRDDNRLRGPCVCYI